MTQRIYHGNITPADIANAIVGQFNNRNLRVQQFTSGQSTVIQLATAPNALSGGTTGLSVLIQQVEDGISISMSKQAWFGIAASLGVTTIAALHNPLNLLNRLDDIAQDVEYLQLVDRVWEVIDLTAKSLGSGFELSERLNRYVCVYCATPNTPGDSSCQACGAPLGDIQPRTCQHCGYVILRSELRCPNCGKLIFSRKEEK
jgi:hypothetical protein